MRFLENAPKEDPNVIEETKAAEKGNDRDENVNGIDENATNITIVVENTGYNLIALAAVRAYHQQAQNYVTPYI